MRTKAPVLGAMLVANMAMLTVAGPSFGILASTFIELFDLSRNQVGLLNSGYAAVGAIVSPFTGRIADKIGGRNMMTIGFLLSTLVFLVLASAGGFLVLLFAGALSGMPNGMANQGTNKYISAEVPIDRRGVITGIKQSGVTFGVFLAGLLLPRGVTAFGYRSTMLAVAVLGFVGAAVIRFVLPADEVTTVVGAGRREPLPSAIRWLAGYAALMGAAVGTQSAFTALYAEEELGFGRASAGLLVGMVGLTAVVGRILLGRMTQSVESYAPVLGAIATTSAVVFALFRFAAETGSWLIYLAVVLAAFSTSSWNAPVMLASMRLVPKADTGRSAGLVMLGFMSGYGVGPPVFGAAVDRLGSYALPWLADSVICLLAAALMGAWYSQEQRAANASPVAGLTSRKK